MKCPACKTEFTPTKSEIASELGKRRSKAKAKAARLNGAKGGRPKKAQPQPANPKRKAK
jgi:hypothetical protein